jgi:hypothetical protein
MRHGCLRRCGRSWRGLCTERGGGGHWREHLKLEQEVALRSARHAALRGEQRGVG